MSSGRRLGSRFSRWRAVSAALSLATVIVFCISLKWSFGYCPDGSWVYGINAGTVGVTFAEGSPWDSGVYAYARGQYSRIFWLPKTFEQAAPLVKEWRVPLWMPFVLFAVPSVVHFFRRRRWPAGHCQRCGYDLTGNTSGRCPECGKAARAPAVN